MVDPASQQYRPPKDEAHRQRPMPATHREDRREEQCRHQHAFYEAGGREFLDERSGDKQQQQRDQKSRNRVPPDASPRSPAHFFAFSFLPPSSTSFSTPAPPRF